MEIFCNKNYYVFSDKEIQRKIDTLSECIRSSVDNDYIILFCINEIKLSMNFDEKADPCLCYGKLKSNKRVSFLETMLNMFGLENKTILRYLQVFDRFIKDKNFQSNLQKFGLYGFTVAKLAELLPLSDESIIALTKDDMLTLSTTVKQIRAIIKSQTTEKKKTVIVEQKEIISYDTIPFDVNEFKKVDIETLSKHNKDSLVKYCLELQDALIELLGKK